MRVKYRLEPMKKVRAIIKVKTNNNMRIIKINNFYINTELLNNVYRKGLKQIVSILTHEKIHSKIFRLFKIKKMRIYILYRETEDSYYLCGKCKPLETINIIPTLVMTFFHAMYDVIYGIFYLNIKELKRDIRTLLVI